jgi:hypothetical protein
VPDCVDSRVFHTHQQSGKEIERVRESERVPPLLCMPLLQVDSLLSARHSVPMANCSPASRAGAFAHDSTTPAAQESQPRQPAPFEASSGLQPHSAGGPDRPVKSPLGLARICPRKAAHVEEVRSWPYHPLSMHVAASRTDTRLEGQSTHDRTNPDDLERLRYWKCGGAKGLRSFRSRRKPTEKPTHFFCFLHSMSILLVSPYTCSVV